MSSKWRIQPVTCWCDRGMVLVACPQGDTMAEPGCIEAPCGECGGEGVRYPEPAELAEELALLDANGSDEDAMREAYICGPLFPPY